MQNLPLAWLLIVFIFWAVSSAKNTKKKRETQARLQSEQEQSRQKTAQQYAQRQTPVQVPPQPAPRPAAPAMSRQDDWDDEEENWDQRDAQRSRPAMTPRTAQPAKRHETKPLEAHMHTPVMGAEGTGTEGIDCCHEYMLDRPAEPPADFLPLQEETESLRAKALLQGVIYSEILGRRPLRRYGAKRPAAR